MGHSYIQKSGPSLMTYTIYTAILDHKVGCSWIYSVCFGRKYIGALATGVVLFLLLHCPHCCCRVVVIVVVFAVVVGHVLSGVTLFPAFDGCSDGKTPACFVCNGTDNSTCHSDPSGSYIPCPYVCKIGNIISTRYLISIYIYIYIYI